MHQSNSHDLAVQPPLVQGDRPLSTRLVYVLDEDRVARIAMVMALRQNHYAPHPYAAPNDLLDDLEAVAPGCIVVGTLGPDFGAVALLEALGARIADHPVVVCVALGDVASAVQAIKQGASYVIEQGADPASLPAVLDPIFAMLDCRALEAEAYTRATDILSVLSPREYNILRGLVEGLSSKQIAHVLGLNARTVELSRSKMMHRLRANTLSDVLGMAFRAKVLPLNQRRKSD